MLFSTLPTTDAERAVIARARQATDFKWVPVADMPSYTTKKGNYIIPKGEPITGFPYSSTEKTDKFITDNISIYSFISAISNPDSQLYQPGHGRFSSNNFGMVCNGLVRYALGIKERVTTNRWMKIPGMRLIAPKESFTVDDIRLCDVLHAFNDGRNHVALITDILRDENGTIAEIEVSEAVRPFAKRATYSPERFYEKYKVFALIRYDKLEEVPPLDARIDELLRNYPTETPKIAVDNGDKSNYLVGDDVIVSVFGEDADTLELVRDGEVIESRPVGARARIALVELKRGYYMARLVNAQASVDFAVCEASISYTINDGAITITANPNDPKSEIYYMDYRTNYLSLEAVFNVSDDEKASYTFTRDLTEAADSFKVYFKNPYGVWVHPKTKFK